MTGKLEGIPALNTDTTSNKFCQAMSKKKGTICNVCYSWNMLKTFRKNAVPRFKSNSDYLIDGIIVVTSLFKLRLAT